MASFPLISIALPTPVTAGIQAGPYLEGRLTDSHGRLITDLRISVTDRCNYKCVYCRTGEENIRFTELPIEDYLRIIRIFVSMGIEKVRITGGEPLLRSGLIDMIAELARMKTPYPSSGIGNAGKGLDIALTTNGHLLESMAAPLKAAGLNRITVSMDAVDSETFTRITRVPRSLERVLAGIRAARDAGLGPVKVNCVLLRDFNDDQIERFAEFSRVEGVIVRFIEWMPLEEGGSWRPKTVVTLDEIVSRLNAWRPLVDLAPNAASETARRFTFDDGLGEIGIIAPVSRPFCGHCSRVRITSDLNIRTCLFSQTDHDLYKKVRENTSDMEIAAYIRHVVFGKEARHHIGEADFVKPARNMVQIGG